MTRCEKVGKTAGMMNVPKLYFIDGNVETERRRRLNSRRAAIPTFS